MPTINPISGASSAVNGSSPSSAAVGTEFNSFIKLLTAQVKNQDPLAPLDSTQFVEQLATFSALEQQVQTNGTLNGIAAGITQLQDLAAALWAPVSAPVSSWLGYESGPVAFDFDAAAQSGAAALVVRDAAGLEVSRTPLDLEQDTFVWEGLSASDGQRRMLQFSVEWSANGTVSNYAPVRFT